jgi:hypothetical protein
LVWRGAGAWRYAPGRSGAGASPDLDKSHKPHDWPQEFYEFDGTDEFGDTYQFRGPDEFGDSK